MASVTLLKVTDLPKLMLMKRGGYASSMNESEAELGEVFCGERSAFNPFAKIEVEWGKGDGVSKYVHLRFYHSNKYWARSGKGNSIVAVSNQPEEDTSKESCTLFFPTISGGLLYLTHVQSGLPVRTDSSTNRVYVDPDRKGGQAGFALVDCDALVKLPKRVTFRGDNGKYLHCVWDGTELLPQFSGSDAKCREVAYRVHLHPDGHVRLESERYGRKFLRLNPADNWIQADSDDMGVTDGNTLFRPKKFVGSDATIGLHHAGNDTYFCTCHTDCKCKCRGMVYGLYAAAVSEITTQAKLVVGEPVSVRNIRDVKYRMEDARVFGHKPWLLATVSGTNSLSHPASVTVVLENQKDPTSYSFTNSFSLNAPDVKSTIQAAIPSIDDDGNIRLSPDEVTIDPFQWGKPTGQKQPAQTTFTVHDVPAYTNVTVKYQATLAYSSVPFSYAQYDDAAAHPTQYIDGIFHGANCYALDFHVTQLQISS